MIRYVSTVASAAFAIWLYSLLLAVRPTIPDSDLTRYVQEFNTLGLSFYNMREPIYWALGKLFTSLFNDAWSAVTALDMIGAALLLGAMRRRSLPLLMVVSLILSPLFVLGICNIHRQLIGFAAWIFLVNRTEGKQPLVFGWVHIIPFLIHNALGLLSLIYFTAFLIAERRWRIIAAIGFAALGVGLLFGQAIGAYFREGTDTSTSAAVYVAWSLSLFAIAFAAFPRARHMLWFAVLGTAFALLLFSISGGSSGSRFFMLVAGALAFWMFDSEKLRRVEPMSIVFSLLLAMALIVPTLSNSFTREILRAAYYHLPFGTST